MPSAELAAAAEDLPAGTVLVVVHSGGGRAAHWPPASRNWGRRPTRAPRSRRPPTGRTLRAPGVPSPRSPWTTTPWHCCSTRSASISANRPPPAHNWWQTPGAVRGRCGDPALPQRTSRGGDRLRRRRQGGTGDARPADGAALGDGTGAARACWPMRWPRRCTIARVGPLEIPTDWPANSMPPWRDPESAEAVPALVDRQGGSGCAFGRSLNADVKERRRTPITFWRRPRSVAQLAAGR